MTVTTVHAIEPFVENHSILGMSGATTNIESFCLDLRCDGEIYQVASDDDIRARLWKWLAKLCWTPSKPLPTTLRRLTRHVGWKRGNGLIPPNVIAFDNGLLDVEAYLAGSATLLNHTPHWFTCNCLPHGFDHDAACPRWLEFLDQMFDGDGERSACLQQWLGYNLIADNRQQKLAMLIGPPRSGNPHKPRVTSSTELPAGTRR